MLRNTNDFTQKVINKTINHQNKNGYKAQLDITKGYLLKIKKDGKTVARFNNSYQKLENWFKFEGFTYVSQSGLAYDDYGKNDNNGNYKRINETDYLEAAQMFLNLL